MANVATGLWGSGMIKEMLKLRGRELESWYASMDGDRTQSAALFAWILREELFALKLEVEEPDGWKHRGTLPGGGPFIAEDRVVALDVSRATGDQLRVRIRPPVGFWALNSFAVDYGPDQTPIVEKVSPIKAWSDGDRDMLAELSKSDDAYYAMPNVGDRGWSTSAPPPRPGMERTVFLHSRGYYRLHLTGSGNPIPQPWSKSAIPRTPRRASPSSATTSGASRKRRSDGFFNTPDHIQRRGTSVRSPANQERISDLCTVQNLDNADYPPARQATKVNSMLALWDY